MKTAKKVSADDNWRSRLSVYL